MLLWSAVLGTSTAIAILAMRLRYIERQNAEWQQDMNARIERRDAKLTRDVQLEQYPEFCERMGIAARPAMPEPPPIVRLRESQLPSRR